MSLDTRAHAAPAGEPVTLPLLVHAGAGGELPEVRAPGGYASWRLIAHDPANDRQFICSKAFGSYLDALYLRAYRRYLRRPTHRAPPLPRQFPSMQLSVYERGRLVARIWRRDQEGIRVRMGDDAAVLNAAHEGRPVVYAKLRYRTPFQPAPSARRVAPSQPGDHWLCGLGMCDIEGTLTLADTTIPFTGLGLHEQLYGTRPLVLQSRRWLSARVLASDRVHGIEGDPADDADVTVEAWSRAMRWGLRHPLTMRIKDGWRLTQPRVLETSPLCTRLLYDATGDGQETVALCDMLAPQRLRSLWWRALLVQ